MPDDTESYINAQPLNQIGNELIGEGTGDVFGFSTALSGDGTVLAVGAPLNEGDQESNSVLYYKTGNNDDWFHYGR